MQLKVFTLPYEASLGGFNDEPLRAFLTDKEVLDIDSQFDYPYFLREYNDATTELECRSGFLAALQRGKDAASTSGETDGSHPILLL